MSYTNRIVRLKEEIQREKLDATLVSSVSNIIYLTGFSNFSETEREAYLFITPDTQYVITDGRYSEAVKKQVPHFEIIEISSKLPFKKVLKNFAEKCKVKKLGVEEHNLTVSEYKLISKYFNAIQHQSINKLREIKEQEEIDAIKNACRLGDKAFEFILNKIKPGITEKEVAFEIEFFIKKQGADISFKPIVAFGANSSIPHHKTSDQRLASSGHFVLFDFGVKLNNYCSDMTRTVFFGSATAEFKKMYQTVLSAQEKAIEFLTSHLSLPTSVDRSIKAAKVDSVAKNHIISRGYPTIPHSLGHGVGLEVHEAPKLSPISKDVLKPGMVFSIEPGIYIPSFGGVRIEDLVVIEKNGLKTITKSKKTLINL